VTAGNANRLLIAALTIEDTASGEVYGVSYGNQWLSKLIGKTKNNQRAQIWYLLNPPTGSHTLKAWYLSAFDSTILTGSAWYGVDQDTPFGDAVGATGADDAPAVNIDTGANEWVIAVVGADEDATCVEGVATERWDEKEGTNSMQAGYVQDGDAEDPATFAATLSEAADWAVVGVSIKPASTSSQSFVFCGDTTTIWRCTYDSDVGVTIAAVDSGSQTLAGGVAGQPAKMNGTWYFPMGSGANAQKLGTASDEGANEPWDDVTGNWKADHLCTYQKGVTPTLARVNSTTQNTVELNADTGDVTDAWTNETQKVGDTTAKCTGLAQSEGFLFVGTEIGLYDYGQHGETRPVTQFLSSGKIDADNGRYTMPFGDIILYQCNGGLLRYRIGSGALPIGINDIDGFRFSKNLNPPLEGRHAFTVAAGKYWYVGLNYGQQTYILQLSRRRGAEDDREYTIHTVLEVPLSKGGLVDSNMNLWLKGASVSSDDRDIRVIELAADGSLRKGHGRGQASSTHIIYLDERNPGRPQDQVQLRHFTVELAGTGWDSTNCYLERFMWCDNDSSGTDVASTDLGSTGMDTDNWTVGTSDTCYRFRPELRVVTSSSYLPITSDPQILRVIVGIRFPEIIEITVPTDKASLGPLGKSAIEIEQNLRRLQNQGVVTFRRPGDMDDASTSGDLVADRSFSGEVFSVTDTMYKREGGYAHGIKLQVRRWVTV
jgi:hypothetical protein